MHFFSSFLLAHHHFVRHACLRTTEEPGLLEIEAAPRGGLGEYPHDCSRSYFRFTQQTTMPVSPTDLQRVMAILADEDELKATVKSSGLGGVIAGITTTVGGLVAGPPGLLVGGAIGGALAYSSAGTFKPVSQIIKEMNAHERQLLYDTMRDIIDNLAVDDYLALMAFLSGGPGMLIRQQLMDRMVSFLRDQMRLQMPR